MKRQPSYLVTLALWLALPAVVRAADLVTASNPDPHTLPSLNVYNDDTFSRDKVLTMVAATFPNVPEFTCDAWCYESNVDFLVARALDGGKVELRHRDRDQPRVVIVTTVTPEPGAVEFLARLELEKGATAQLPANPQPLNLCWQLRRARAFASNPDPYPEFIKRCFVFTEKGVVFLDKTNRRPIPVRPNHRFRYSVSEAWRGWDGGRQVRIVAAMAGAGRTACRLLAGRSAAVSELRTRISALCLIPRGGD